MRTVCRLGWCRSRARTGREQFLERARVALVDLTRTRRRRARTAGRVTTT